MSTWREREQLALEQARRWPVSFGLQFFFSVLGGIFLAQNALNASPDFLGVVAKVGIGAALFTFVFRRRRPAQGAATPAV